LDIDRDNRRKAVTLGTIDHLHPNRAVYLSMAKTIDIEVLAPGDGGNQEN
jgi:hypothetical protein